MPRRSIIAKASNKDRIYQIYNGGTGVTNKEDALNTLNGVSSLTKGVVDGVGSLDVNSFIKSNQVPVELSIKESISGENNVLAGSINQYIITNYDDFVTYTLSSTGGVLTRVGSIVSYSAPNIPGVYTLKINNREIDISVNSNFIKQAVISSPVADEILTGVNTTLTTDPFSLIDGSDTHLSTDWQVSIFPNFSTIFTQSLDDNINKTSLVVQGLKNFTTYYVRARHNATQQGKGSWSLPVTFKIEFPAVLKPTIISPVANDSNLKSLVSLTASAFETSGPVNTHVATSWELSTNSNFTNIIQQSINSTSNKTSWVVNNLLADTTYYVRVKYSGNSLGFSDWSDDYSFKTRKTFLPSLETAVISSNDGQAYYYFGNSVAISGDGTRIVAGSVQSNQGSFDNSGSAYIFVKTNGIWLQEAKLTASDKASFDNFGSSVDIDQLGERVLISAVNKDKAGVINTGAVYVFVRSGVTWIQEDKLDPTDALVAGDNFGRSVSLTKDGLKAIVGCPNKESTGANNTGATYVFKFTSSGWVQEAKITTNDKAGGDYFGTSVSISGDGTRIVASSPNADVSSIVDTGAVYIFANNNNIWTQEAKIVNKVKTTKDNFGYSVSIDQLGNRIAIGTPGPIISDITKKGSVFTFIRNSNNSWVEEKEIVPVLNFNNDRFGTYVKISSDSNRLVANSLYSAISGAITKQSVVLYSRTNANWNKEVELNNSFRSGQSMYGISFALDSTGQTLCIGARDGLGTNNINSGSVYIYE